MYKHKQDQHSKFSTNNQSKGKLVYIKTKVMATKKFPSLLLLSMMVFALIIFPTDSAFPGKRISLFRYGLSQTQKSFLIQTFSILKKNKIKTKSTVTKHKTKAPSDVTKKFMILIRSMLKY